MNVSPPHLRNPGPSWGYAFLTRVQQIVPAWLLRGPLWLGTWIAVARMPAQRRHSRAFLGEVLGRPAGGRDVWRHFFAYLELLLLRLRVASGTPPACTLAPENAEALEHLMRSGEPALFGTFHFGHSDLLGFLLATRGRRVAMVRLRVANSADTDMLERQFQGAVNFIWINDPAELFFAMKAALERGDSLAMQCDRLYSSRTESFVFFGARRLFPFAIYHLAVLFQRPVVFCIGLPDAAGGTRVMSSPIYRAEPAAARADNLARAREHFQAVLTWLESLVRQFPYLWFNFLPHNPVAQPSAPSPATLRAVPGRS